MNIPITTGQPAVNDFVFRAADRMRIEGCANAIAREGLNLALFCPFEALLDHYTGLLLARLRQQAPEHSIEVYFPANTDSLLGRFNEVLAKQSVQQATRPSTAAEHTQIWLVHDAQKLPESEIQLLARLIQNFPGAHIRAILLMSGHEAAKIPLPAFGRKILRWDIEVPTEEQAQAALEQAQHSGHFTAVHQLLQRIQRKPLAPEPTSPSTIHPLTALSGTTSEQQTPAAKTPSERLHTFHQHGAKGLQKLRNRMQSLGQTPRFLRRHAKLSLAISAALIASTLFMLWLQPEAFGLKSLKSNPPAPKAQVLALPSVALPTPPASVPSTSEPPIAKADIVSPTARPMAEASKRTEPGIEAPDAAIEAQAWIRAMDPNSFLIQYGTSTTYEKGLDIQRKFPELKQSRIVAAYRPGEKLAHFVIVSGPYNPVTQAYEAAKRPGLPSGSWVRSTRNLQDQLKSPNPAQDTPR
ncbi:MAG: hypothetical protein RJB14_2943 [Pseudomonadota bacterium]|jgi:hypothetical protein